VSFCSGGTTGPRTLIRVRVNDELVLDAGSSAQATGPHGAVEVVLPPQTTLFHQVLAYLEEKPDAVAKNAIGEILAACEKAGLRVVATKMIHMNKRQAEGFYAAHGSDAPDTAVFEIGYFFNALELQSRQA